MGPASSRTVLMLTLLALRSNLLSLFITSSRGFIMPYSFSADAWLPSILARNAVASSTVALRAS